jgi:hypothetical protein
MRHSGNDSLFIDLPVGGQICTLTFDSYESRFTGLELLDGLRTPGNETRHEGAVLPKNQAVRIDCIVTPDSVRVLKDGTEFLKWRGDPRRLGEGPGQQPLPMSARERRQLAVGSWATEWDISQLTLTPSAEPPPSLGTSSSNVKSAAPTAAPPSNGLQGDVPVLAGKTPIPEATALAAAREKLRNTFAQEFAAAGKSDQKSALADKLFEAAAGTRTDLTARYVLLDEARLLWMRADHPEDALRAIDELAAEFDSNANALRLETLTSLINESDSPDARRLAGRLALELATDTLRAGEFETAQSAAKLASLAGTKGRDTTLIADAKALLASVAGEQRQAAEVTRHRQTLKSSPDDPTANLAVGAYYCFQRNDWEQGLPFLAKASDAAIQKAARLELTVPSDSNERMSLADAWHDIAGERPEAEQRAIQRHARTWYRRALSQLTGLSRKRVEKRLAEIAEETSRLGGPVWHPGDVKMWNSGAAEVSLGTRRNGFAILAGIGGQFDSGQEIRLRPSDDGLWLLRGTGGGILAGAIPIRTRHDLPVHEYAWRAGDGRIQTIHRDEGILLLSGIGGTLAGGGESVEVRLGDDDHWYLQGQSGQASLRAWATSIQLGRDYQYEEHTWKQGQRAIKLLHKDDGFCGQTQIAGAFRGGGEVAGLSLGKDGYWYLGGKSAQFVVLRAISIRLRKTGR